MTNCSLGTREQSLIHGENMPDLNTLDLDSSSSLRATVCMETFTLLSNESQILFTFLFSVLLRNTQNGLD